MFYLLACLQSGFGDDSAGDTNKSGIDPSQGVGGTTSEDLPDVRDEMDRSAGNCKELNGSALFGANSYFWGVFEGTPEEGWEGEERWYLFANDTAKDGGFNDCEVVWAVAASPTSPSGCPTCEQGVALSASLRDNTCSSDLQVDQSYSVDYAVDLAESGDSTWYFASGKELGNGYWNGGAMSYLTDASCRWF